MFSKLKTLKLVTLAYDSVIAGGPVADNRKSKRKRRGETCGWFYG